MKNMCWRGVILFIMLQKICGYGVDLHVVQAQKHALGGVKRNTKAKSIDEMRNSRFYRYYVSSSATTTLVKRKRYFEDLVFFCAMAFDPKNVKAICAVDNEDSLFVWRSDFIEYLTEKARKRETTLERMQLSAVAYLLEICYDLMLAHSENISDSPGFESLGLRMKKRNTLN